MLKSKKDKKPKQRIVTWESKDRASNETAFAIIDLNVPFENIETQAKDE